MRILHLAAMCAALTACGAPAKGQKHDQSSVGQDDLESSSEFIPAVGIHPSRTMLVGIPRQGTEIIIRMEAAVKQRPAWFAEWSKSHRDADGTLQYHSNLGVSQEEHRLLGQMVRRVSLQEVEKGKLNVTQRSDGGIELHSNGHAAHLNGIVIHPNQGFVETKYGRLTKRAEINQSDPNAPTGPWRGVQWSDDNGGRGPVIKFATGKRASGEMIIYYDVEPSQNETLVLLYK
jgi:hypothetical protein